MLIMALILFHKTYYFQVGRVKKLKFTGNLFYLISFYLVTILINNKITFVEADVPLSPLTSKIKQFQSVYKLMILMFEFVYNLRNEDSS